MSYKFASLLLVTFTLHAATVLAQSDKREVEDSIDRTEMPAPSLETLDIFWPDKSDIKYYEETDGESRTFEAKLNWKGVSYSIEFSEAGRVIDVEQLIEFEEISDGAKPGIESYLDEEFRRMKLMRLQKQYLANDEDDDDDEDFIDDILERDEEDYIIRYELEVEGTFGSEIGAFELLFDHAGEIIQQRKIIRRSIDNIW